MLFTCKPLKKTPSVFQSVNSFIYCCYYCFILPGTQNGYKDIVIKESPYHSKTGCLENMMPEDPTYFSFVLQHIFIQPMKV